MGNSADKRTAKVDPDHLKEIYAALKPALPRVFHVDLLEASSIVDEYKDEHLFCAFALARLAAAIRTNKMEQAMDVLAQARSLVPKPVAGDASDLAERSALSYIERNVAVCRIMNKQFG